MSTANKYMQSASGVGGAALDVDDVFSTYLYEGNSTNSRNIVNDIDVSGEGGLVWIKDRTVGDSHSLFTTDRGANKTLLTNEADAEDTVGTSVFESFNSDGFTVGSHGRTNENNRDYASWTFRKAPKFFDVVTWTGSDSGNVVKSHNLGSVPGMIMVKNLSSNTSWCVFHRSLTNGLGTGRVFLQNTNAEDNTNIQFLTADSSNLTLIHGLVNTGGEDYVAYIFAHNDGDGEFGPDSDQDIIKCGSYTGTGSAGNNVDLGFEPQWLMIKRTNSAGNWQMADVMRGMPNNGGAGAYQRLSANLSNAEVNGQEGPIPTSTGFVLNSTSFDTNGSGGTYIYIAIRRPTAVPESATEVFDVAPRTANAPGHKSGFVTDMFFRKNSTSSSNWFISDRLRQGKYSSPNTPSEELSASNFQFDYMNGVTTDTTATSTLYAWMWKRAPKYFDVVAYTGNGTAGRTVSHNLGVAPEMMWIKGRTAAYDWVVYHKAIGNSKIINLNGSVGAYTQANFNNTDPTSSVFTLGSIAGTNGNNQDCIAYLFSTLAGISKVGSYTGNGSVQNIDCGFSTGARFVLIKKSSGTGGWVLMDSERGIVSGDESYLYLNETYGSSLADLIDPYSGGFATGANGTYLNVSGSTYIFYAIA